MPVAQSAVHSHGNYPNLTICDHPILQDILSSLREKSTPDKVFAQLLDRAAPLMAYEALRSNLSRTYRDITTPMTDMKAPFLSDENVTLVSILGAGQGLVTKIRSELLPWAKLGYIGIRRDEQTLLPVQSYERLPSHEELAASLVIPVDPMLATAGTASAAITLLKKGGARRILMVTLIAAPEGVEKMMKDHPDVKIFTVSLDEKLDERGFIVPGLGDAGNRYHGITPT